MQKIQIQKNFGCVRFVYNFYLGKHIEKYKAGEGIYPHNDACKDLTVLKSTKGYEWLKDADANSLHVALKNMDRAYTAFFRRVRESQVIAPTMKKPDWRRPMNESRSKNLCMGNVIIVHIDYGVDENAPEPAAAAARIA